MSKEIDENLIEATIRRVAEARAARGQADDADEDATAQPDDLSKWDEKAAAVDDDAVAATLARIQAQQEPGPPAEQPDLSKWDEKAATVDDDAVAATLARIQAQQEPGPPAEQPDLSKWDEKAATVDDDAVAATLARIQAQQEPGPPAEQPDLSKWDEKAATVDDDAVAATLARIQAQQVAGAPAEQPDLSKWDDEAADIDEDAVAATLARVQAQRSDGDSVDAPPPSERNESPEWQAEREPAYGGERIHHTQPDPVHEATVVAELHRALEETIARVAALEDRVAALSAAVSSEQAAPPAPSERAPTQPERNPLDDWDDAPPPVTSSGFGSPPRPAIMRDPTPWTATAAQLEPTEQPAAQEAPITHDTPTTQPERPRLHAVEPEATAPPAPERSGFDLLPKTYRVTIEDKRRNVDLVPLHRALLGIDGVRDMSLLSYANGVAIVSVETAGQLTPESLQRAVAHAMARETEVQVHNETTMVVKIGED